MAYDIASHRPDQHASAHRRRKRLREFTDLGAPLEGFRSELGELRLGDADAAPKFGVLGAQVGCTGVAVLSFVAIGVVLTRHRTCTVPAGGRRNRATLGVVRQERTDDIDVLRAEVARLRELVGPDEKSYVQLQLDLMASRDAAIGAEAALGTQRGYNAALEAEVVRLQRDFRWFRDQVVLKTKRVRDRNPLVNNVVTRLGGR